MSPGDRVEITGGEHYARRGVLVDRKVVRGERCVSVRVDKPFKRGYDLVRVVVVFEDHVIPEYQSRTAA